MAASGRYRALHCTGYVYASGLVEARMKFTATMTRDMPLHSLPTPLYFFTRVSKRDRIFVDTIYIFSLLRVISILISRTLR